MKNNKEILLMHDRGMSYSEIAGDKDISRSAVAGRIRRARKPVRYAVRKMVIK